VRDTTRHRCRRLALFGDVAKVARDSAKYTIPFGMRLPRNVIVLSWVSFFQDAASEMLYPVLPLFLIGVLGAPPIAIGLMEGLAEAAASLMKVLSGRWADRFSRKPLTAAGYGLSSIAKGLIALAHGWVFVLFCRVLDRCGKGVRTSPRDALIASDTPAELRGRAFGFHRACDTAGAVVGPLLGLMLYEMLHKQMRALFVFALLPALVSVALVALVREGVAPPKARAATNVEQASLSPAYYRVVIFLTIFSLANFSDAFIIVRIKQLGLGFVAVLLAYALYNASYALLSYPAGILSDRLPRSRVFVAGLIAFALAYLGLGFTSVAWSVWWLLPVYGAYAALTDGVGKAWISDFLPPASMGYGLGLYQGMMGGASLIAGIWAGLLWGVDGTLPFLISGVVVGVLAIALSVRNVLNVRMLGYKRGERSFW
jgi:MFS family permease